MKKAAKRPLSTIVDELHVVLKRETSDIIEIGRLLFEAKKQVGHGKWIPWLKAEFSLSKRTAQNYMAVHKFVLKNATVAHLKLSSSALYWLANTSSVLDPEVIRSILDEAREKPVGEDRCKDICYLFSLQDGAGAPGEDGVAAEAARQAAEAAKRADEVEAARQAAAEAAAILDGPPPELPPTSPESTSSVRDESERKALQHALDTLRPLVTKPVAKFNGVAEQNDLVKAADFLSTMVGRKLVDIDEPGADDPVASAEQRKAEYAATEEQARILSPAEFKRSPWRRALPSPKEANRIAKETGRAALARDGFLYFGTSEADAQAGEDRRRIVYGVTRAVEMLSKMEMSLGDFLKYALPHQLWTKEEEPQLGKAKTWLTDLCETWASLNIEASVVDTSQAVISIEKSPTSSAIPEANASTELAAAQQRITEVEAVNAELRTRIAELEAARNEGASETDETVH